jgi:hypothetical protein
MMIFAIVVGLWVDWLFVIGEKSFSNPEIL